MTIRYTTTSRRAFTLGELIVAVGLVALLTVAIGQLFSTVTRLTGTGTAIAETDALARTLEQYLRNDIAGFNRMRADETYLAIRCREIGGDQNLDSGTLNLAGASTAQGERELYLTRDDRLADQREVRTPYANQSRSVTSRLDEFAFITLGGTNGGLTSFQQDAQGRTPVSATHAFVIYGHGLRPAPDRDYDPTDPNDVILRQWLADDGSLLGSPNFALAFGAVGTSNEFAGDFLLGRQQYLLFGGLAAGYPAGANRQAPLGDFREYAPYIRDYEADTLYWGQRDFGIRPDRAEGGVLPVDRPNPRLKWQGRVDVIAQDLFDARRWLEGEEDRPTSTLNPNLYDANFNYPEINGPTSPNTFVPSDATAFDSGLLDDDRRDLAPRFFDFRLWRRYKGHSANGGFSPTQPPSRIFAFQRNVTNLQSALAGTLTRPLIQPDPFPGRRTSDTGTQDPSEARMDIHALIAERCSSFEVAWSDGSTWLFDETAYIDTDGVYTQGDINTVERILTRGDLIWFDMNFTRQDLWNVVSGNTSSVPDDVRPRLLPNSDFNDTTPQFSSRSFDFATRLYPQPSPDPEIGDRFDTPSTLPLAFTSGGSRQEIAGSAGRQNRLFAFDTATFNDANDEFAEYEPQSTGGVEPGFGDEYLAIFGFRKPNGSEVDLSTGGLLEDEYEGAWDKPKFLRVRATLHDKGFRIEGGRTYEFVFALDPIDAD